MGQSPEQCAPALDGTWGGTQDGVSAQVIVVGASVIGFFWRDDYRHIDDVAFAADGRSLYFDFKGGTALLTRSGERVSSLRVNEGGQITLLSLQRD